MRPKESDEAMNRRVAEIVGYYQAEIAPRGPLVWHKPDGKLINEYELPNYCSDLNAMRAVEEEFIQTEDCSKDGPSNRYYRILDSLSVEPICYATARQRAEAFVKVMEEIK